MYKIKSKFNILHIVEQSFISDLLQNVNEMYFINYNFHWQSYNSNEYKYILVRI